MLRLPIVILLALLALLLTPTLPAADRTRQPSPTEYLENPDPGVPPEPSKSTPAQANPAAPQPQPQTAATAAPTATTPAPVESVTPTAAVSTTTNAPMDTLDDKHRLAVGDRISFRILEDEEEAKPLIVTDSGEIEVPYIGRAMARGNTCKELARALKVELEKEYYYQATVIIALDLMARSRGKVYLVGPVRAPGPQEVPSDETLTVSKAILRAGGFMEIADKKNVRITRKRVPGPGEETIMVNVGEILEKGRTEGDVVLEVGDLIYIPERLIRF